MRGVSVFGASDALSMRRTESMYTEHTKGISVADLRWDEMTFLQSESGPTAISFMRSSVRPDYIRMEPHGITLWYLPPALAWTTRLYPFYSGPGDRPRSYRPVDHYQYMLATYSTGKWAKPVAKLYSGGQATCSASGY